jgi:uncharacterized surface protein with fasciclin (FAS1) repeats
MRNWIALCLALVLVLGFAAPISAQGNEELDIVDTAVAAGSFNTLAAALTAADLVEPLKAEGPYTVFAPTDDAFAALLEESDMTAEELLASEDLSTILLYHVVEGEFNAESVLELVGDSDGVLVDTLAGIPVMISVEDGNVFINDAQVVLPDVEASNGVIHVVDSVILPPTDTIADIVTAAASDTEAPEFTTLLAAVSEAGLAEALAGEGPFTVFAPTDAAFATALETLGITAEDLLANPDLANILLYHVVGGEEALYSNDVAAALEESMDEPIALDTLLEGDPVYLTADEDGLYIDGAQIIVTDILASNGVIHVIDAVILPDGE